MRFYSNNFNGVVLGWTKKESKGRRNGAFLQHVFVPVWLLLECSRFVSFWFLLLCFVWLRKWERSKRRRKWRVRMTTAAKITIVLLIGLFTSTSTFPRLFLLFFLKYIEDSTYSLLIFLVFFHKWILVFPDWMFKYNFYSFFHSPILMNWHGVLLSFLGILVTVKVTALNEANPGSVKSVFKAWEERLNSSGVNFYYFLIKCTFIFLISCISSFLCWNKWIYILFMFVLACFWENFEFCIEVFVKFMVCEA